MIWLLVFGALLASGHALNLPENKNKIFLAEDNDAALSAMCDDVANKFEKEYIAFMRSGVESETLRHLSQQLAKSHTKQIVTAEVENLGTADLIFVCTTCRATVNVMTRMFRDGGELSGPGSHDLLKATLLDFCNRFDIQTEEVCGELIESNLPIFKHILDEGSIDSKSFCGTFLQATFCEVTDTAYNWKLAIDATGSAVDGPKSDIPAKGNNDLKILHLTDIHYDPLYEVGSLAECDEPQCCQRHKDDAQGTAKAAGQWGDYRECDTPWHTIVASLDHIKETHETIDYVYHTGDVVDHAIWLTSREKNKKSLEDVNQQLKSAFGDIPVYPTIGNHENHPFNVFAPPDVLEEDISSKWLYELLAELWSAWLPASTKETITKGGYYTVSPRTGFRIIALNNNDCYVFNWWILYDGNYLSEQLQWLHDTLLQAEKDGEYVHILAHIPTGTTSCWNVWSREFNRIVERFSTTISGVFNGHTHRDEFSVYYSNETTPVNVAWNGGSLTTFTDKNPNYKLYQVEPTSFQVVEQEAWYFNLTAANLKAEETPKWELEYKMTEAFELKDLSPASVDGLLTSFSEKPALLRKYWKYYVVQGDPKLADGCSDTCLKNLLCLLARGDNTQTQRCEELIVKLQDSLDNEEDDEEGSGDGDGGAASIMALKITTILSIYFGLKYFL